MNYIPFHKTLKDLDIKKGDILLVASDVTRLIKIIKDNEGKVDYKNNTELNKIIDCLQELVGNEGTLLFPTYNWDFCEGKVFDYKKTPSKCGALSNIALKRNDFKRTKHPIYSFAVWGKYKDYLYSLNNTDSFGKDSPFDFLYQNNGKYLMIDIDYLNSFTFLHYVEESVGTKYRYIKDFLSEYIDEHGNKQEKKYSMYVRDLELETENTINPIGRIFEEKGIAYKKIINNIPFILLDISKTYDIIKDDIINNSAKSLVTYKGQ